MICETDEMFITIGAVFGGLAVAAGIWLARARIESWVQA